MVSQIIMIVAGEPILRTLLPQVQALMATQREVHGEVLETVGVTTARVAEVNPEIPGAIVPPSVERAVADSLVVAVVESPVAEVAVAPATHAGTNFKTHWV